MKDNKTIKAVSLLSSQELKWFREFVHSPYFNKHENLRKLIDIIFDASPQFAADDLQKETVFKKIFPKEKFNPQKLSDLLTYLYRLYDKFLAQLEFESDEMQGKISLLRSYRLRKQDRQFLNLMKLIRENGMLNGQTENRFLKEYQLETESDLFFTSKDSRTTDKSIERKTLSLDLFYLTAKLRSCCDMLNRQNIISQKYEIRMLDEVKSFVAGNFQLLENYPAIPIYYQILLTLQESEREEHYHKLVELLERHSKFLPRSLSKGERSTNSSPSPQIEKSELRTMYDYAQNYCIKKINSGNTNYLKEIFRLYKTLLAQQLMLDESGSLSQWDYKNIVTVGTRLKEYAWCEKFLHDYKEKLPPPDRENAFMFNLATLYYSQKNYHRALKLLQTVEFTDVYYSLGARSLLLKVYFEANEFEPLYSLFDSFKIYLKRNKLVSEYQYRVHFNLIKMTKRLANIRAMVGISRQETIARELEKLKKKIEATPEITNLHWLMERVGEMEKLAR
ncbi:MAG TPA: hypothetical protein VNJ07_12135 [Chitinophagales bacterium]|nr:hypothetical protein [Chitinophagales bacterium]